MLSNKKKTRKRGGVAAFVVNAMASNRTSFVMLHVCAVLTGLVAVSAISQRFQSGNKRPDFGTPPAAVGDRLQIKREREQERTASSSKKVQ